MKIADYKIQVNSLGHYESPVTGERWTKEQWEQYVAFEEARTKKSNEEDQHDYFGNGESY